ncbi:MAG: DUF559 domain-containing protein [Caldilineaceae bacterium]
MPTYYPWQLAPDLWSTLKPLARQMRKEPTRAEARLWQRIRKRQIAGVQFRRQVAIERFIVDFCSIEARLIIEVDGAIHQYTQEEDTLRQAFLESRGFRVLRFRNDEVLGNLGAVVEVIVEALKQTPP